MKRRVTVGGLLGGLVLTLSLSAGQTWSALNNLRQFKLDRAAQQINRVDWVPQTISTITLKKIPLIEIWREISLTIPLIEQLWLEAQELGPELLQLNAANPEAVVEFRNLLQQLKIHLNHLEEYTQESWLAERYFETEIKQLKTINQAVTALKPLLSDRQTYLVLLQNSEELRATGGFLGSYAELTLNQGLIEQLKVEDIYVPDGQFKGFVEAPPGARQYLSGGKGLRLPDANWHPDFPTSAQRILNYFAYAQEQNLAGAVAVNLPLVEDLLNILGPVQISDYSVTVTANNLADVARADRQDFFPGSQQKKHFLSLLLKQLLLRAESLEEKELREVMQLFVSAAKSKEILFYAHDPQLQKFFLKQQLAGELRTAGDLSFFLVESNVGINKANQHVQRAVELQLTPQTGKVQLNFTNHNPKDEPIRETTDAASHLNYVNYQRLIIPTQVKVEQIRLEGQTEVEWTERLISNSQGDQFKEIGFLVVVPAESSRQAEIQLSYPELPSQPSILVQKQPGLPPTNYHLLYLNQDLTFQLVNDQLLRL